MYFQIHIAINGKHIFSTDERSTQDAATLMQVAKVLNEKFPTSEGYSLTVSYFTESGRGINRALLMEVISTNEVENIYHLFDMHDLKDKKAAVCYSGCNRQNKRQLD